VRSALTFRPAALLATRATTTAFQRCSDTGKARAGGRARTFRSAARVRAALRSPAGKSQRREGRGCFRPHTAPGWQSKCLRARRATRLWRRRRERSRCEAWAVGEGGRQSETSGLRETLITAWGDRLYITRALLHQPCLHHRRAPWGGRGAGCVGGWRRTARAGWRGWL